MDDEVWPEKLEKRHHLDDGQDEPNPYMLELAHTWWQTKGALEQAPRDAEFWGIADDLTRVW